MGSYIASQSNRVYVVPEETYGTVPAVTEARRTPVVKLKAKEQNERIERHDKTGSRTFWGNPNQARRTVAYEYSAYLSNWATGQADPPHGAFLAAAFGGETRRTTGLQLSQVTNGGRQLTFAAAHGLLMGQAVAVAGELRFVSQVVSDTAVEINAPFTVMPAGGTAVEASVSYRPGTQLSSVSIFDYWSPSTAAQRVLSGAAVDKLAIEINGDFHKLTAGGPAAKWIDSTTFAAGQGGMTSFPAEPTLSASVATPVPGHLGQAWIGSDRFYTLTSGVVELDNDLDLRDREFGVDARTSISAGMRKVRVSLGLHAKDDAATMALYAAARSRQPVSVMLQLGQQAGQMMGIYLPKVMLETPEYDDSEQRLAWSFVKCRAQGAIDDEIFAAFA